MRVKGRFGKWLPTPSRENVAKYYQYCRMYGFRIATRLAWRRLRKPKGKPPQHPPPLSPILSPQTANTTLARAVTIIIPTKDAGHEFRYLLRRLLSQEGVPRAEVVIVDSGSTDSTIATAQQEGARVLQLLPELFTHALARNKGAEIANGDYLVFLTQDALPLTDNWLHEMITTVESNDLAAVSCAEYPRAHSDLFYQFLIHSQYESDGLGRDRILSWDDSCSSYLGLRANVQLSDVATLIRRDVFRQYRYRAAYAEDVELGQRLIRDGYKLGFLNSVRVLHSHDRPAYYFLKRGYVDVKYLVNIFRNFVYPEIRDKGRLYSEIVLLHGSICKLHKSLDGFNFPASLTELLSRVEEMVTYGSERPTPGEMSRGCSLAEFMETLRASSYFSHQYTAARSMLRPHVMRHFERFRSWVGRIYDVADKQLARAIVEALEKIFALHCGTHLGYLMLTCLHDQCADELLARIDQLLSADV